MKPILMTPAYRYGEQTPWGGNGLRNHFGKRIPDDRTGEALEMSVIPGLNSRDENGNELSSLIDKYDEHMVGTEVKGTFPLLLKLLDARERLSVQVHPDDAYAAEHEGKLGKTEAWIILHAEPGAGIIYGVREGVTKEMLREASGKGREIENLLRFVPVHAGEVYYIPAGTVHAICEGILLYEIQQSSDVTYRFYDWDRTDRNGKKRQLHIEDAVNVTNTCLKGNEKKPIPICEGKEQLLCNPVFTTERWKNCSTVLMPDRKRFSVLTAIDDTWITWDDGEIRVLPGQTVFLPADGERLSIKTGELLLSYPTVD